MDKEFKSAVLKKALSILNAINCKYYIVEDDGTEHGEPITKKIRKENKYPYGKLNSHVKNCLDGISAGESRIVSVDQFDIDSIQATACNYMRKQYGISSFTTNRAKDRSYLSVLCLSTEKEAA